MLLCGHEDTVSIRDLAPAATSSGSDAPNCVVASEGEPDVSESETPGTLPESPSVGLPDIEKRSRHPPDRLVVDPGKKSYSSTQGRM